MNRAVATPVERQPAALETDPDLVGRYLEDAAHYPGGVARALARPASLEEVAAVVRDSDAVLVVGAQSSLTGGATPAGDVVLSTERLVHLLISTGTVRAGAGVTLAALQDALRAHGWWFPPAPTFLGATVGGVVATNAAGAATFKYGPVRPWVQGLTVVLAGGDVLRLRRGEVTASDDGRFVIATGEGERVVQVPDLRMPDVPKCSAGYFAGPGMDLVDLFIGAEGTLGIIVEAELRVRPCPAGVSWMLVPLSSEAAAIGLTGQLRAERRLDVAAIEHMDRRSLDILREDGVDRRLGIRLPDDASVVLLVQLELSADEVTVGLATATLERMAALLGTYGALEASEIVLPSEPRRAAAFVELREAVPAGVNRRVALARTADPRIHKTAADMIVPFDRFGEMMEDCRALADAHGLDLAVWGHISDGNVHPNVVPRTYADVERGRTLILELARRVVAMGGSPLAEHGVGRNPVKQQLLGMLHGRDAVEAMRRVKLSLDPDWRLGAGLLFERTDHGHAG